MKAVLKFIAKAVDMIATIRTTIYKDGGAYMVKDEVILFGMVVATDTRKASEVI